jgi:hypothetical protein
MSRCHPVMFFESLYDMFWLFSPYISVVFETEVQNIWIHGIS